MPQIDCLTYLKYDQYSNLYMINLTQFNNYLVSVKRSPDIDQLIKQWIEQNCYLHLPTHAIDDFTHKVNRNLQIAKRDNDHEYITYICDKLKIVIDQQQWIYIPNKIKVKLKTAKITNGYTINQSLATWLNLPIDTVFHYRSDIVRLIHQYIYDHQLQNRYDKHTITPDDQLSAILVPAEREYTYTNLPQHIIGIIPPPVTST